MQSQTYPRSRSDASVASIFMRQVYQWMTVGLGVTALTAYAVFSSHTLMMVILTNRLLMIALIVVEFGFVIALSSAIHKMSSGVATGVFLIYALLNGLTLSVIFVTYPIGNIANAFLTCTLLFLAMSIYGATTKRDLTGMGNFLFMGLIGIIIAAIVNIFLGSGMLSFVISCVGVIVFTGLTAYDTQKLRQFGEAAPLGDTTAVRRGAILGALTLYLDFINLFLMLLRLFGGLLCRFALYLIDRRGRRVGRRRGLCLLRRLRLFGSFAFPRRGRGLRLSFVFGDCSAGLFLVRRFEGVDLRHYRACAVVFRRERELRGSRHHRGGERQR